ncbi:MAG: hypothetical protein ACRDH9_01685 [Actinomycetota bacterium]
MVGSAFLRVFQPLDALPEPERQRAEHAIVQGRDADTTPLVYRHLAGGTGSLGLLEASGERTEVRSESGSWYGCPTRNRLRVLAAMLSLRETVPSEVAEALVPEMAARRAARELARIRRRDPRALPTMLESPWHVPVRWFVLFGDEERVLAEREDGGFTLTYWTKIDKARRRAQRGAAILERGDLRPVAAMVREMDDWLSSFGGHSAVELDYADVALTAGWNDLDEDHSAREVQESIDALEEGEIEKAGEIYRSVAGRWAEAKIRESLN